MNIPFLAAFREHRKKIQSSFDRVKNLFFSDENTRSQVHTAAFAAFSAKLLYRDGKNEAARKETFKRICEGYFSQEQIQNYLSYLDSAEPKSDAQISSDLADLTMEEKKQTLRFMLVLAIALGDEAEDVNAVIVLGAALGFEEPALQKMHVELIEPEKRRQKIVNAGWGIGVALIVIILFILIAKVLPSIIYGLILAALLLPLTEHCAKKIRRKRGLSFLLVFLFKCLTYPLQMASKCLKKHSPGKYAAEKEKKDNPIIYQSIGVSVFYTLIVLTLILALMCFSFTEIYKNHAANMGNRFKSITDKIVRTETVNQLRKNSEVKKILDTIKQELIPELTSYSKNLIKYVRGLANGIFGIFSNILLSIVFAIIFLVKFAQFQLNAKSADKEQKLSVHLVKSIFNGVWLPKVAPEASQEAGIIIEGLLFRLRLWLKGYFTLVAIDSTVYSTIFLLLGIPFAPLLGVCSGCALLLPYLGPIFACVFTLTMTAVFGKITFDLALIIICCYLIYNGVIEQFILYPAVIGDALGLNSLETIAVVLLGAVFAGIPGMIFALPIASAAKFLIPKIYNLKTVSKITAQSA